MDRLRDLEATPTVVLLEISSVFANANKSLTIPCLCIVRVVAFREETVNYLEGFLISIGADPKCLVIVFKL